MGVTPFTIWGARPQLAPPVPFARSFHELNVRTYVVHGRTPGVWFFSLDAASALAVMGARLLYHLPYFRAAMSLERRGDTVVYRSRRTHAGAPPAELACVWHVGAPRPAAAPGTLEFFLVERYALFALHRRRPHVARIHHAPWPLQDASVSELRSTMVEAAGMPAPAGPPLVHYAEHVAVDIWPLTRSHP